MTIFIGFDWRCGSRTGGPSGARRRNAGAVRPSWPSTDCTALWSDTRSLCRKPSSNRPKRTNASPRGFSVNIASITAASGFTLHRQIPPALDTRRQPFFVVSHFIDAPAATSSAKISRPPLHGPCITWLSRSDVTLFSLFYLSIRSRHLSIDHSPFDWFIPRTNLHQLGAKFEFLKN